MTISFGAGSRPPSPHRSMASALLRGSSAAKRKEAEELSTKAGKAYQEGNHSQGTKHYTEASKALNDSVELSKAAEKIKK